MAYYNETLHSSPSFVERMLAAAATRLQSLAARHAVYRVYRTTYTELNALSDRELNDLGLARAMISSLAWETAQERAVRRG